MVQQQQRKTLLTPQVKALIGQTNDVVEMYDVVDKESIRRYVIGIPDHDPRHWDEELAAERYGGVTAPPLMLAFVANRKPPWESTGGLKRSERSLPRIRDYSGTTRHLHGGDEFEVYRYPRLGDRIFYQSRYLNIEEKFGRSQEPFLVITTETRWWNQDDETLFLVRNIAIER